MLRWSLSTPKMSPCRRLRKLADPVEEGNDPALHTRQQTREANLTLQGKIMGMMHEARKACKGDEGNDEDEDEDGENADENEEDVEDIAKQQETINEIRKTFEGILEKDKKNKIALAGLKDLELKEKKIRKVEIIRL